MAYDLFETFHETLEVLGAERHAGSAFVASEVLQQVAALLEGGVDVENILGRFGRCTLTFVCKPQRYLKSGDDWRRGAFIDYLVNNPTAHPASPLLHLQTDGAAMNGTVTVNGETVTVTDGPAELIIDTEEATAQWEGTDYTDKVAFSDIITLKPGANELSLDGISRCWVKPRWWVL